MILSKENCYLNLRHIENKNLHRILIVEDEPAILESLMELLELSGYITEGAQNGLVGLQKALTFQPDVIISDVLMPELNGFGFVERLKQDPQTALIPVLFLTAKADTESMIHGLELQAHDYITKPFDAHLLLAKIKNVIEREKLIRQESPSRTTNTDQFVQTLDAILDNQIANSSLMIGDLAEQLNMSPATFNRTVKRKTGKSPARYLKEYRLNRAKELLINNAGNVSEIAYQTGFSSLSYFSTEFKKAFSFSPSEEIKYY